MEARTDGAYRCADRTRNLLHREVAVIAKDDSDPVIGTECREGAPDRVAVIDEVMGVRRGRRLSCSIQIVVASELPSTKPISAGVDEDAIEPGVESLGITEPAMLLPGSYECVVGRIFRLLCVAEDESRQPVCIVEARTHEPLECGSAFDLGIGLEGPTGVAQLSLSTREPPLVPTHQMPETFNRERGKPNASREVRESLLLSRAR